ncbi:hypothetical protein CCY99_03520 [Helicobacter sp. 16-1353]|uniref:hypothetical protein n=1 Tax=Helicobacter sp. 16-1353 TaxID=2004996 RepID=UPI000DCDE0D7|nr:hypothetical protein [Helicobacter sp. 16-1353]RAX54430.1 hypothetical protein CCY99_03520 [Helicobacter sp. 16-1353]
MLILLMQFLYATKPQNMGGGFSYLVEQIPNLAKLHLDPESSIQNKILFSATFPILLFNNIKIRPIFFLANKMLHITSKNLNQVLRVAP